MKTRWLIGMVLCLGLGGLPACDEGAKGSDEDGAAASKKKSKKGDDQADEGAKKVEPGGADEAQPAAAKPGTDAPTPVEGQPPPTQPAAQSPGGRSAVPNIEEWNAQTKEVTVKGSSALNCETKMVREWLRVSCRGKNFSGGEPTGVTVTSGGGRGDDFVFSSAGVASLVVRFVEGVDVQAQFTWSDRSHALRVWWPRGAPEPPPKGEFQGVPAGAQPQ